MSRNSWGNSYTKFNILDFKFHFTCGNLNFYWNTLNCKHIMSVLVDLFEYAEFNKDAHSSKISTFGKYDNLVLRQIPLCRIKWSCSVFLFFTRNKYNVFGQNEYFKTVCCQWNLVPTLIRIWRTPWSCSIFLFLIAFSGKFLTKNQNCHFLLKFGAKKFRIQNLMVVFIFSVVDGIYFFWAN